MAYISPTYSTTNQYVKYRLVVDLLQQDTVLNKSKIRRRLQAWRTNTGYETYGTATASVRNDLGAAANQGIISTQKITYNSYTTLFDDGTAGIWINHNTDGSKSLQVGGYFTINAPVSGGWNDFTIVLPSIPRGSVPTATAANIEEASTININKYNSAYTSTLRFEFPSGEVNALIGTIVTKTTQTSYGWILPNSFYAKIPTSSIGVCKLYCDTYLGDTLIETKSCLFNANVNPVTNKPNVSAVIQDTNSLTLALTGNSSKLVKYASNANIVITASAKNSASISSVGVTCGDGKSSNQISSTLNGVESGSFNVIAIDSRSLSNTVAYTKELINYVKLTINPILVRNTVTDSKVKINYSGNYFNVSFGVQSNTLTVKYRYREYGTTTWSAYYTFAAPTISGNTFSAENIILAPGGVEASFDYLKSFEFQVVAYDKIYTSGVAVIVLVASGVPIFDFGKEYFNHNTPVYFRGQSLQEIFLGFYPIGSILMNTVGTNPSTYLGGSWVAWGVGRVPVGVNTSDSNFNTVEKTGGASKHTLTSTEMPVHTHTQNSHGHLATSRTTTYASGSQSSWRCMSFVGTNSDYAQNVWVTATTATNQNAGGGGAHNNLQPYITCYMWKRTA